MPLTVRPTFDAILEDYRQTTVNYILKNGELVPMLTIFGDGPDEAVILAIDMPNPKKVDRHDYFRFLGAHAAKTLHLGELQNVFFAAEVWAATRKEGEGLVGHVSEQPDRIENVMVIGWNKDLPEMQSIFYDMQRDGNGTLIDLTLRMREPIEDGTIIHDFIEGYNDAS